MVKVSNYKVRGYYKIDKTVFKYPFEKEVRAISPDKAVEKVKQYISTQNVDPRRIFIQSIHEITDPKFIKDRVIKAFEDNEIRL
ncbi:MAG: hypothetical protein ACFFCS_27340 [Candidatus Hodarchaeota archaeon]